MGQERLATTVIMTGALGAALTSSIVPMKSADEVSFQIAYTSGASGTFAFQGSNDFQPGTWPNSSVAALASGTWVGIDTALPVVASGGADVWIVYLLGIASPWMRVTWTPASGAAGTVTASAYVKSF